MGLVRFVAVHNGADFPIVLPCLPSTVYTSNPPNPPRKSRKPTWQCLTWVAMSLLGIVLALVLLMVLAYRGISVLLLAPLMALLAATFSPDAPLLASYTQVFMPALGAFVVAFAVYPMARALFRAVNLPKRLILGTIALGAFTFTMTALPGTPAIQNAIPMPYFGTTPFAAPGLGLIGGAVMLVLGTLWLVRRAATAAAQGEGYGLHEDKPEPSPADTAAEASPHAQAQAQARGTSLARALAPVVLVIVLNYLLATWLLPAPDTRYLAKPQFGATAIDNVRVLWAVTVALAAAIVLLMLLQRPRLPRLAQTLEQGAGNSVMPLLNTASQVCFGAVITLLGVCGLSYRQSYADIFVVAVAIPVLALVVVVTLGSVWGVF